MFVIDFIPSQQLYSHVQPALQTTAHPDFQAEGCNTMPYVDDESASQELVPRLNLVSAKVCSPSYHFYTICML